MPRSYDLNPVSITHHPTQRLDTAIGKLPPFDIQQIIDGFLTALKDLTGIDLTGIRDFLENLFGAIDWSNLPDAGDVWQFVVSTFIQPIIDILDKIKDGLTAVLGPIFGGLDFNDLPTPAEVWSTIVSLFLLPLNVFSIPADVQASIDGALGDLQDALDGSYTGSGPIFLAVKALAEAWLKVTDPLNAANLFGRIGMPQLAGGVSLADLTTATSNLLDPFTAESVPTSDGWSYNSGQDAAQVVADGSTKGLWLKSGVIKVEEGQPVNTSVKVKYSGVSSGAGDTIRFVLETYESEDGSGPMVPVTVAAITNPSGMISSPVTLGDTSWDPPPGVQSVRPLLEVDELVTAGTVYWVNTPVFRKTLLGVLSDGLPAALQKPLDDIQATWDKFKGAAGGTVDDIEDALNDAGQAIRDAIANALGHSGTGHTSANILTYLQNIPKGVVDGLEDWWDLITGKTANITTGGLFDAAKLSNITGTAPQSLITGLSDLAAQTNQIVDILAGSVVTPINDTVQAVKDWFHAWFGGGSTQAIPISQKGASNGVATLDSSGNVPLSQLGNVPGEGGSVEEHPHVLLTLPSNLPIPNATESAISGWEQGGSVSAVFDDGTNTRFTLPQPGWWSIESQIVWASSTTGVRQAALGRVLADTSTKLVEVDGSAAANFVAFGSPRNKVGGLQDVSDNLPLDASDKFLVSAYQNSGGSLNAVAGYPDGTYVLATFIGDRQAGSGGIATVTFDAVGVGIGASSGSSFSWTHTASGDNRAVIVVLHRQDLSGDAAPTVTYGGTAMTRAGVISPDGGHRAEMFILLDPPTGVKTVAVSTGSTISLTGNSLSYTGVGGYGTAATASGSAASLSMSVSSDTHRRVVQMFASGLSGRTFSSYNQTSRFAFALSGYGALVGDAAGATSVGFTATQSGTAPWRGLAVDLHAAGE